MKKTSATIKKEAKPSAPGPIRVFLKNLLMLGGFIILLLLLKNYNNGYKWAYGTLLRDNLLFMNQTVITEKEKLEYKLGFSWKYMNFLKENTPEDAIIRLPPDSAFFPANQKSDFNSSIRSKVWTSYFVYPRNLVYESEKDSSLLYEKATHQAIVNYWGYHKLPYEIKDKIPYTILPLNKK